MADFAWYRRQPTGSLLLLPIPVAARTRPGPPTPSTCSRFEHDMISTLTLFVKPAGPRLFDAFGLPLILRDAEVAELPSTPHHF